MTPPRRGERRQQILETLASELESHPGHRITTARLAAAMGLSEAALYRHFVSKARMFEGLIEFAESSVFGLFARIREEQPDAPRRIEQMLGVMLGFAARNPGIARVLTGEVLVGEDERLRARVSQYFERCETELRQILMHYEVESGRRLALAATPSANLMVAWVEGRIAQYLRSGFRRQPDAEWGVQWAGIRRIVFGDDGAS